MNSNDTIAAKASIFLSSLREATTPLHLALESNKLMASLTDPGLTIQKYQAYLAIMSKVIIYFENQVQEKAASLLQGWNAHSASESLSRDLLAVERLSQQKLIAQDFYPGADSLNDHAALGFLYVMEGSKLGGRVIFKQVKRHIGLDEDNGASYLADSGSDTLPSWKQFIAAFSHYIAEYNGEEQAIYGANLAFSSIAAFFDSNKSLYEV